MTFARIVIASAAKQSTDAPLDCFAALAMTKQGGVISSEHRMQGRSFDPRLLLSQEHGVL